MDTLIEFLKENGWQLTLIALAGIVLLGILKYANVFGKLDKKIRHVLYIGISVLLSVIGSLIYLAVNKSLDVSSFFALTGAIFALNQGAYALYDTLTLKELMTKLLDYIFKHDEEIKDEVKDQIEKK